MLLQSAKEIIRYACIKSSFSGVGCDVNKKVLVLHISLESFSRKLVMFETHKPDDAGLVV